MTRRSLMTALVVAMVFLAGALAGAAVMRIARERQGPPTLAEQGPATAPSTPNAGGSGGPGSGRGRNPVFALSRVLDQQLDLSDQQKTQVRQILDRRSQEARQMFQESRHRFRDHLDSTVAELKGVLTPDQATQFQKLLDEMRARRGEPRGARRQN